MRYNSNAPDVLMRWAYRYRTAGLSALMAAVVSLPVIISVADAGRSGWWPVDDHALTGLSAFDVFHGHPPVMGPRTTTVVASGVETHHPGPLLYYLLAVPLLVFGGQALGLLVGSALITIGLAWLASWAALRAFGPVPAAAVAATFLGLQWALGPGASVLPFNPYPPAFATLACAVLLWALSRGHLDLLPHTVVVVSLMIQSHMSYLAFLAPGVSLAILIVLIRWVVLHRSGEVHRRRRQRRRARRRRRILRERRRRRRTRSWGLRIPRPHTIRRPHPGEISQAWRDLDLRDRASRWFSPTRAAIVAGVIVWLPPAIELVRFHPHNNLEQVLRYVAADRGVSAPFMDVFLTGVGLLAPFSGGMVTAQVWQGPAVIATEPRSVLAVVVGAVMLACVLVGALLPARAWARLCDVWDVLGWLSPSANERALARVVLVLVLGCMALGYTIPVGSTIFTWNYLQLWAVAFCVWMAIGLYTLRRVLWLLPGRRHTLPLAAALIALISSVPAVAADRAGRWDEGRGVHGIIGDVRTSLAEMAAAHGPPRRHVAFETNSLGTTYGIAPSVAFGIKDDRRFHLGAIWALPEDTDFRKTVSMPPDSIRIVIRDGRPEETEADWAGVNRLRRTFQGPNGGWYTLWVVDRSPRR